MVTIIAIVLLCNSFVHNQKLLHSLTVLQIEYSGIIVVLFHFYEKIITHVQILSTLYHSDLTSMFKHHYYVC